MSAPLPRPPQNRPQSERFRARPQKEIPNEPEDIAHRERAERVRKELAKLGIYPTSPGVYPTVDRTGFVRFTFDEVDQLTGVSTKE